MSQSEQLDGGAELRGGDQARVGRRHGTETLAARLNTTANRIQLFRENREQRHVNCDMNVISSVNPQPIKALLDLATTFE